MRTWPAFLSALLLLSAVYSVSIGDDPNLCDIPTEVPDVVVGDLYQTMRHGSAGGITAYSIGTISCNAGSCWIEWNGASGSNEHPVIGQNMFRYENGRFEQIGQSWLKHGFLAVSGNFCDSNCVAADGAHLGVNCSDPYSSFWNGKQNQMGPKFEVNPSSGFHPHPATDQSLTGGAIYKRLQVHDADIDPHNHAGARYFVEGQYVAADDSAAGMQHNNASYREVQVVGAGAVLEIELIGETEQGKPAIRAWGALEPGVQETDIEVPGDGMFIVASTATDLQNGLWRYEYAVQNLNSHRAAISFSVPLPVGAAIGAIGFHDVDYHSGETQVGTDWSHNGGAGDTLVWSGEPLAQNPDANALRWGTLYNFRFNSDIGPGDHEVSLGLFRPGVLVSVSAAAFTPSLCNDNGVCDPGEDCGDCPSDCADGTCDAGETGCNCPADCGPPSATELQCTDLVDDDCDGLVDCGDITDCCGDAACVGFPDFDGDGYLGCADCNGSNGQVWSTPGEVPGVLASKTGTSDARLGWSPVTDPGGASVAYEAVRTDDPTDFYTVRSCIAEAAGTIDDAQVPGPGQVYYYLVRATNDCPEGDGSLGQASDSVPRTSPSCGP